MAQLYSVYDAKTSHRRYFPGKQEAEQIAFFLCNFRLKSDPAVMVLRHNVVEPRLKSQLADMANGEPLNIEKGGQIVSEWAGRQATSTYQLTPKHLSSTSELMRHGFSRLSPNPTPRH